MSTISCPNCNSEVSAEAAFCDNCGMPLTAVEQGPALEPGVCPNCGAQVLVGELFCDQCGQALPPAPGFPTPAQRPAEDGGAHEPAGTESQPSGGARLLVLPAGYSLHLPTDRDEYVIGRIDPASGSFPDVDLVPFGGEEGGVSRRHARIRRDGNAYAIEDLNSVNYTFVNKRKLAVGEPHALEDGDEIRLGRVLMRFKAG